MHLSRKKEDISICYLSTLCAHNGIDYEITRNDADSTDAILKKVVILKDIGKIHISLRIQLKSTSSIKQYTEKDTYITYKLKVKNYNDLCQKTTVPIILCLLILPEDENSWVKWTNKELLLRGSMYWTEFSTEDKSNNENSITIKINKKNIINEKTLLWIFDKIAREDWP